MLYLAKRVRPGRPKSVPVVEVLPAPTKARESNQASVGPWTGRRVLVLGGDHAEAAAVRSRIVQLGASCAINLTAGVTHVLLLEGGQPDARLRKAQDRELPILENHHLDNVSGSHGAVAADRPSDEDSVTQQAVAPKILSPGAVMDIPTDITEFTVNVAWSADKDVNPRDVDVVAFELGADTKVPTDDEFVFYNQPTSPDGAVRLSIDGDREQGIAIDLTAVDSEIERITVGAAIDGETFGDVGALSVTVDTADITLATAVLDAATTERSMIIVEVYRRNGAWRLRALGQGYDDGLAEFAVRHGVEIDD